MAMSKKLQAMIKIAIPDKAAAAEMIADAGVAAHVANVVVADATDLATAIALANANKVTINAILAAMQAAGQMS
jgi:hypothetical protein